MAIPMIADADIRFGAAILRLYEKLFGRHPALCEAEQDETRNRRDFMLEMLDRNPDAFASEHDIQSMMRLYPGQF